MDQLSAEWRRRVRTTDSHRYLETEGSRDRRRDRSGGTRDADLDGSEGHSSTMSAQPSTSTSAAPQSQEELQAALRSRLVASGEYDK